MADDKKIPKTKAGLIKSALTLNVPSLIRNFKEKPIMSTIKAAIIGTPAEAWLKKYIINLSLVIIIYLK